MSTTSPSDTPRSLQEILDRLDELSASLGGARPASPAIERERAVESRELLTATKAPVRKNRWRSADGESRQAAYEWTHRPVAPATALVSLATGAVHPVVVTDEEAIEETKQPSRAHKSPNPLASIISWAIILSVALFAIALGLTLT